MKLRLPRFLVNWLAKQMNGVMLDRNPDQEIGPPGDPYMMRWIIWRKEWLGGIYVHLFLNDDDDRALHDHPWPSVSFVIGGHQREIYSQRGWNSGNKDEHSVRMIRPGDVVFRGPGFAHRIELYDETSLTLFIVGPHIREWGFHCPKGWRHWREYSHPTEYGQVGRGCD